MPRNMSFSLTTDQVRNRTKTVTRRLGWWKNKHGKRLLHVGDVLNACVKCMGLKPGESIERICLIRVTGIRRETLLCAYCPGGASGLFCPVHAKSEAEKEGFPNLNGTEFVQMFCDHMGGNEHQEVTRIEFEYLYEEADPQSQSGYVCGYCGRDLPVPLGKCPVCFGETS